MLFGQPNLIPQRDPNAIEDRDLRKRAKYLRKCKDALWSTVGGQLSTSNP
jgi:hypothetical protein